MHCANNLEQNQLLKKISEVSFAVDDILLFLDTHPEDEKALSFFEEYSLKRKELMAEYEKKYGPLTIDGVEFCGKRYWKWMEQPFPWEQKGGCR